MLLKSGNPDTIIFDNYPGIIIKGKLSLEIAGARSGEWLKEYVAWCYRDRGSIGHAFSLRMRIVLIPFDIALFHDTLEFLLTTHHWRSFTLKKWQLLYPLSHQWDGMVGEDYEFIIFRGGSNWR